MFIPRFSFIAAPLTRLTGKDIPFKWTEECRQAVRDLKKAVTSAPVLIRPDTNKQFELEVNASGIATRAILYQRDTPITLPNGKEKPGPRRPVGFHSQKFTSTECNYPIYDREFLAIMRGLRNWSHLLKGTTIPVLVYTTMLTFAITGTPGKLVQGSQDTSLKENNTIFYWNTSRAQQTELMSSRAVKTTIQAITQIMTT